MRFEIHNTMDDDSGDFHKIRYFFKFILLSEQSEQQLRKLPVKPNSSIDVRLIKPEN